MTVVKVLSGFRVKILLKLSGYGLCDIVNYERLLMHALIPRPLQSADSKALKSGLFKILNGIKEELQLSQGQLVKILRRPKQTVNDWFNKHHEISISRDRYTPDDVQIYELIELYDCLTSYFVKTSDQIKWLNEKNIAFGNISPLEYIYQHPSHLRDVRMYLERRMNP